MENNVNPNLTNNTQPTAENPNVVTPQATAPIYPEAVSTVSVEPTHVAPSVEPTPVAPSVEPTPAPIDIPITREQPINLEPKKEDVPVVVEQPKQVETKEPVKKGNIIFIIFIFLLIGGFIYILPNANTIFSKLTVAVNDLIGGKKEEPKPVIDTTVLKEIQPLISQSTYLKASGSVSVNLNENVMTVKTRSKSYDYTLNNYKITTKIVLTSDEDIKVFMAVYDAILQNYGYAPGYADEVVDTKTLETSNTNSGITKSEKENYVEYSISVASKIMLPEYIKSETLEKYDLFDPYSFTIVRNYMTLVKLPYSDKKTVYYVYNSGQNDEHTYQTVVTIVKAYLEQNKYLEFIKNYSEVNTINFENLQIITNYALTDEEKLETPNLSVVTKIMINK